MKILKIKSNRKSKLISEVSERDIELITDILEDLQPEALAFNDLFNGKIRFALKTAPLRGNKNIDLLYRIFEKNGYELDFIKGTASKDVETQYGKKKRTMKVGKILSRAAAAISSLFKVPGESEKTKQDLRQVLIQLLPKITLGEMGKISELGEFWANESERYRNPTSLYSEFIIISRHPIDVIRMADFEKIESCHSPPSAPGGGGSYYRCAIADARGNGAIAYLVDTSDIKKLVGDFNNIEELNQKLSELDDQEIFKDNIRDVQGIVPKARVRIRRFDWEHLAADLDEETDTINKKVVDTLAVPESTVYPYQYKSLYDRVSAWAKNSQQDLIDLIKSAKPEIDDFVRRGGTYTDNPDSELFEKLLGMRLPPGKLGQAQESDDEAELEPEGGAITDERVSDVFRQAQINLKNIELSWELEEATTGPRVRIFPRASIRFKGKLFKRYIADEDQPNFLPLAKELQAKGFGLAPYQDRIDYLAFGGPRPQGLFDTERMINLTGQGVDHKSQDEMNLMFVGDIRATTFRVYLPLEDPGYSFTMDDLRRRVDDYSNIDKLVGTNKQKKIIIEWLAEQGLISGTVRQHINKIVRDLPETDWNHEHDREHFKILLVLFTDVPEEYKEELVNAINDKETKDKILETMLEISYANIGIFSNTWKTWPGRAGYPEGFIGASAYSDGKIAITVSFRATELHPVYTEVDDNRQRYFFNMMAKLMQIWKKQYVEKLIFDETKDQLEKAAQTKIVKESFYKFDKILKRR